jgi:hypothetical protein
MISKKMAGVRRLAGPWPTTFLDKTKRLKRHAFHQTEKIASRFGVGW